MSKLPHPKCPTCGFAVFNRRYPKCESCGAQLPEEIVFSADERSALIEADRKEDEARAREREAKRKNDKGQDLGNAEVGGFPGDF